MELPPGPGDIPIGPFPICSEGGVCVHVRLVKGAMIVVSKQLVIAGSRGGDERELFKLARPLSPTSYFFISHPRLPIAVKLSSISFLYIVTNLSNLLHLISREVVLDF